MDNFPFSWENGQSEGSETSSLLTDLQRKFLLRVMSTVSLNPAIFIDNYEDIKGDEFEEFIDNIVNRLCE